jgi:hypothetical protein
MCIREQGLMKGLLYSVAAAAGLWASLAAAEDSDVLAIHGDVSRSLFGGGTGVVIGFVDSGIDSTHPALAGNDSLGHPRLFSAANFVIGEPTTDDISASPGHGTPVASAAISSDPVHTGLAPDARYINARVLDSSDQFHDNGQVVMNGVGYAVSQGATILNLSLNFNPSSDTSGNNALDLMLDWAAQQGVNITVAAGNIAAHRDPSTGLVVLDETPPYPVQSPGSFYNGLTVGRTGVPPGNPIGPVGSVVNYNQVFITSRSGPVSDSGGTPDRDKPDIVAPGTSITLANNDWETGSLFAPGLNGTSISAPLVAGMMAQQIGYGQAHGLSTNPLVIKATMLNSAVKVLDKDGSAWKPRGSSIVAGVLEVTSPLDVDQGTGQVDGARLFTQYTAGQQGPGTVGVVGWDLHTIFGISPVDYTITAPQLAGSTVDVTLDWFRHVSRTDDGNGMVDSLDTFTASPLANLDLSALVNGNLVAKSMSTVDNVEYLHFALPQDGVVTIQVDGVSYADANNPSELYGLAWNVVPEPAGVVLAACGAICVIALEISRRVSNRAN